MDINILSVVVATVVAMVIGSLWYSPLMFVKPWMALLGITPESMKEKGGSATKSMIGMLVVAFIRALIIAWTLGTVGIGSANFGALAGLIFWAVGSAPMSFSSVLFENRPFKLFLINTGNDLVTLVAMGAIIGEW